MLGSMEIIDQNLLKYPALATLLTGILLSVWTQWGLLKHYWVVLKLVLTLATILIGIFFLNDWTASLASLTESRGNAALASREFQQTWSAVIRTSSFNLGCLLFMIVITYLKPFGKIRKRRRRILHEE
ncbi:hypothetical protein N6H14_09940 [Paenibacillus sp. CC-CFT747]|nr:hypothetical protein N6H14_09940 [Paenibacillus sp. CC-CFT747]